MGFKTLLLLYFCFMNIFNITPLLSTILGFLLTIFILFRKAGLGQDKRNRYILGSLVYIYTLTCLDSFLELNDFQSNYQGYSYLFYHLPGYLFFYFIVLFSSFDIHIKRWKVLIIIHTILRWIILLPLAIYTKIEDLLDDEAISLYTNVIEIEYLLSSLINISLTGYSLFILLKKKLILTLDKHQTIHYKWLKLVIFLSIVFQIGSFINSVLNTDDIDNLDFYLKIDTLLMAIFFFVFAYSVMHFPVFVFTGHFNDLPEVTIQKYAKSSLHDSSDLYNEIKSLVETEKLYLEFDLKLNVIADKFNKSVHHISQAINQNANMSYPDFINRFRIEDAKLKLLEPKPDTIYTISLDVGFNSKAAFYNAFKKVTNQTPTQFKKENKK